MRIAILGAGGVGGVYGGLLARSGHRVGMLARGAHRDALASRGIEVRMPDETFVASVEAADDPSALTGSEVAIVSVKGYSLAEVAPAAKLLAESGATVLPLLNGVEAAERLASAGVPRASLLGGLTEISALRVAPGVVQRRSPFMRVVVGELEGGISERAERIAGVFRDAGVEARASADIEADLWRKLAFIATLAAACGLTRSPIGPIRAARYGSLLLTRGVREALAVARARGVAIDPGDEPRILDFIASLPEKTKPSFLLDLEANRQTELDDLSGAVSRLGRLADVETPIHDTAVAVLDVPKESAR